MNMTLQRVLDEMHGYKYIQYIQFNHLQVTNINYKMLFVYSYYYSYIGILSLVKF